MHKDSGDLCHCLGVFLSSEHLAQVSVIVLIIVS